MTQGVDIPNFRHAEEGLQARLEARNPSPWRLAMTQGVDIPNFRHAEEGLQARLEARNPSPWRLATVGENPLLAKKFTRPQNYRTF
jgi:predicted kinase